MLNSPSSSFGLISWRSQVTCCLVRGSRWIKRRLRQFRVGKNRLQLQRFGASLVWQVIIAVSWRVFHPSQLL